MIPTIIERDIHRSGTFQETKMGIAKGSEAWIFNILRNSTYTDKIGSPMREYIANALDEHQKLGKSDVPVEVTFPTAFSNEFRVRDFGAGLSDEDVVQFFANYGASDKRESNDLIGAFGIGCKSAFAYSDSFTIVSYKDGVKTTFNMYIDETDIGSIAKLTSTKTKEENGIEIIIPVKPQDVNTFVTRGFELMKYFKTKPLIKGVSYVPDFKREASPVSGKDWRYFGDNRGSIVIQGQIGYPVDPYQLGTINYNTRPAVAGEIDKWEYSLLSSGLEIEVPIGEVEVTASRESLQMSEKTIKAVRKRLAEIRAEIVDLVSETFKSAKTLVEAKTAYYNFFQKGGSYGQTLHSSIGTVKWKGQDIKDNVIELGADHKVMQYTKKWNGDITLTTFDRIKCSDDLNLYYDDTDRKLFMYRRRAKTLLDAGAKMVAVVQTDDKKAFKAETGIDADKLPKYSTVVPTILASTRAAGNGIDITKRVKHKVKVFELDVDKLRTTSCIRGPRSNFWKVAEIELDTQVFIPIDRFEPNGCFDNSVKTLKRIVDELELLGVDLSSTKVYGVKPKQDTAQMVKFENWIAQEIAKIPDLADEVALIHDFKTYSLTDFVIDDAELPDGVAKDYRLLYKKAKDLSSNSAIARAKVNLAALAKLDIPNKTKLFDLSTKFQTTYPLIPLLNYWEQQQNKDAVVDYIKLVDEGR